MTPVDSQALARRYAELAGRYDAILAQAEGRVVEWRWSRPVSHWDDLRPLAAERHFEQRGRLLRSQPAGRWRDHDQVGLDADGRPAVIREHSGDGELKSETLIVKGPDRLESTRFDAPRAGRVDPGEFELRRLTWLESDADGRPLTTYDYGPHGRYAVERYDYDELGRLRSAEEAVTPGVYPAQEVWDAIPRRTVLSPSYDANGLAAVDREIRWLPGPDDDQSWTGRVVRTRIWRRPVPRSRVDAWVKSAEDFLLESIPALIAASRPQEPLAAVGLLYSPGAPPPPDIGLLTASERHGLLAEHGDGGVAPYLWSPPEWSRLWAADVLLERDPEQAAVLRELNHVLSFTRREKEGRDLLNRVARELNRKAWPVAVTDDFVVFSADGEGVDTPANLRAAVPAERLMSYGRRGWSPSAS